ncbi:ankyrin repeat and SOCS box protein 13 isoform X3 [Nycticebus coucang]|uniref:ankyrin repeat and SOCS box protein 13 isoform X3 n=1 Tax=Nycticebus coucang TaxID=9470 RepID=UPI00234CB4D7|nr:ankyrin repeat and SOCS box protein 13 isoform X3 [Nycticebus coucang]XP_053428890.1 ankyrin repeat and SOCS box protein 13 isoform X3 [Nycticebus coucang]XP_053428891.1 ankyrin repeat and SOCS box protein 13 isoform X3 [Nycticebus coucang]
MGWLLCLGGHRDPHLWVCPHTSLHCRCLRVLTAKQCFQEGSLQRGLCTGLGVGDGRDSRVHSISLSPSSDTCFSPHEVDARNIDGSTPLCDACASGSIECVKLLLSYGAKVNPPLYTASPLHEACMSGSSECVRLLIDVGANLEAHDCHFGTPLHVACAREHLDCVKVLLNAGANVNAAKLHETALHHAAKVKSVDLIEMLVEFGGNVYARDNRGKKPSDYAWSSSAPAKCLEYYEKTPLTLSQLCRVSLRRAAGVRGLEKIAKLDIPPRLIDYLSYN